MTKLINEFSASFASSENGDNFPDVFEFLAAHPKLSPDEQFEIVLIDQYQRWKHQRRIQPKVYFDHLEDLTDGQKVELLLEEFGYLEKDSSAPDLETFVEQAEISPKARIQLRKSLTIDSNDQSIDLSGVMNTLANDFNQSKSVRLPSDKTSQKPKRVSEQAAVIEVGSKIGRYTIEGSLGQGAFGEVFRAKDPDLDRSVAIKIPTHQRVAFGGGVDAFIREARAVARLDHPNIVPVYDFGITDDKRCFVVSKFIQGKDLKQEIKRGINHIHAARITARIARALHAAHRSGIVHRDVKPANIIIDDQQTPHLLDFGLALQEQDTENLDALVGTPAYMSPEQARGEGHRVDGRSDIYSLAVILYEMICGRRPWPKKNANEVLNLVKFGEVKPPRQWVDSIPRELERICLKALARRLTDRYNTARDFAEELESYLAETDSTSQVSVTPLSDSQSDSKTVLESVSHSSAGSASVNLAIASDSLQQNIKIIPKGLRSFDRNDAEFFLQLVPGPRDRRGLPDSIRFWKNRIEERDGDETFSVGLLYGPSGCGKSSLVKAGLIPLLSSDLDVIYTEAATMETESRILNQLYKRIPDLPKQDLQSALKWLRRNRRSKTVLIIDQFEQWLHSWKHEDASELIQALGQCDGSNVQAILMVRDDFWMAATRLMREIEVPLMEGRNSAAVDLFDYRHARKVLTAFGQAFGALPEKLSQITEAQEDFIKQSVDGLAEDGKVISVRLALFAEMFKGREWTLAELKNVGGTEGVGVTFLDEAVGDKASPQLRPYVKAGSEILQALLPETGADIKGNMRSTAELKTTVGLEQQPRAFSELINVLDQRLRLITPTESVEALGADESESTFYQLTHDFLVPSIREWLTRKQRSTVRGRARLRLQERAALWDDQKQNRLLPGLFEFLQFRTLTQTKNWNTAEQNLMKTAASRNLVVFSIAAMLIGGIYFGGKQLFDRFQANSLRNKLYSANIAEVPKITRELESVKGWANQLFEADLANGDASKPGKEQLYALLATARPNQEWLEKIHPYLMDSGPEEVRVICEKILESRVDLTKFKEQIWADEDPDSLNVYAARALLDSENTLWKSHTSRKLAELLVRVRPSRVQPWLAIFEPFNSTFAPVLDELLVDHESTTASQRDIAAEMLASIHGGEGGELFFFIDRITKVEPSQFAIMLPELKRKSNLATQVLRERFQWKLEHPDPDIGPVTEVSNSVKEMLEPFSGVAFHNESIALKIPLEDMPDLLTEMKRDQFVPIRLRPYAHYDETYFLGAWTRGQDDFSFRMKMTEEELRDENAKQLDREYFPVDITTHRNEQSELVYNGLWRHRPGIQASIEITTQQTSEEWIDEAGQRFREAYFPVSMHCAYDESKQHRVVTTWMKRPNQKSEWTFHNLKRDILQVSKDIGRMPIDFCFVDEARTEDDPFHEFSYLVAWDQREKGVETWEQHHLNTLETLEVFKMRRRENYKLVSIAGIEIIPGEGPVFGMTWTRPAISLKSRDEAALERAKIAVTLYRLGDPEPAFEILSQNENPTERSYLIHRLKPNNANIDLILEKFLTTESLTLKSSLLFCIAELEKQLSPKDREDFAEFLRTDFGTTHQAELRGAMEWLMRKWGMNDVITKTNQELAGKTIPDEQNWFVSQSGVSMVRFAPQPSVKVGSTMLDNDRSSIESPRNFRIEQRFAIATHEVSRELYQEFLDSEPQVPGTVKRFRTIEGGPAIGIRYFDAAQFCNWLSEREGIPEDQWCFEPIDGSYSKNGLRISENFYDRTGYRMPTEIEWEFACRAGTSTTRYYGEGTDLIGHYAWHADNAEGHAWPAGLKKPNQFGLFDMLGNVSEWCVDFRKDYATPIGLEPRRNRIRKKHYLVKRDERRVVRGGSYWHRYDFVRSPYRDGLNTQFNSSRTGMRLARTLPQPERQERQPDEAAEPKSKIDSEME